MDPKENKETPQENKPDLHTSDSPAPEPVSIPNTPLPPLATPGVVVPSAQAQSGAGHVDLSKILLPKKEVPGHTVDSAQRINAGALLEQEIAASVEGTHAQTPTPTKPVAVKAPAPVPAEEESIVKPLETYQRDIESVVQHDHVSVLSIATAEAERRSTTGETEPETKKEKTRSLIQNIALILGGIIFLAAASGALAYLVTRPTSVPVATIAVPSTPFISVDAVKDITITPDEPRGKVLANLDAARQATSLSLGLISQLLVTESSSTPNGDVLSAVPAQNFFTLIAPHMPPGLARSLKPGYLLGVHVYNGNQSFVLAGVYSYEAAYSGMLSWETFMQQDLSPLFKYTPSPRIPEQGIATSSANSTNQFIQTGFVDKIVENHDARVLQNEYGDVYLLWTFLDRNTLVITTNDATLREIISRLKVAPITPIPGK